MSKHPHDYKKAGLEIASVAGDTEEPRVVTPDDPLVITSTNASFEWVQIKPGGEVVAQVQTSIAIKKLEKQK
jgi:hypothetical protein